MASSSAWPPRRRSAAAVAAVAQRLERAEMAREQPRVGLADMADAEREDEAVRARCGGAPRWRRRGCATLVSARSPRVFCEPARGFALASRLRGSSVKMSAGAVTRPASWNNSMLLPPRPSMSKALRETKCFSRSTACAGQIEPARAAAHDVLAAGARIVLAHRVRAAGRAFGREHVGLRIRRALVEHHVEHLRDDVAGALDRDRVADADIRTVPELRAVGPMPR